MVQSKSRAELDETAGMGPVTRDQTDTVLQKPSESLLEVQQAAGSGSGFRFLLFIWTMTTRWNMLCVFVHLRWNFKSLEAGKNRSTLLCPDTQNTQIVRRWMSFFLLTPTMHTTIIISILTNLWIYKFYCQYKHLIQTTIFCSRKQDGTFTNLLGWTRFLEILHRSKLDGKIKQHAMMLQV